jgi:hypothetical protein
VQIEEHKPISKLKRWLVISGEKRAKTETPIESDSEKKPKSKSKAKAQ